MYKFFNPLLIKLFLLLVFIGFSAAQTVEAANLVSSVDRHQISEDETLNLTITLDDAGFSGNPDLAGLDSNFQIVNSRSSSSTSIINGSYTSQKAWYYTLLPKNTGKLLIPSFKLKNVFSDAIEIEVLAAGSANKNSSPSDATSSNSGAKGDLFIEQHIDKTEAYVQEAMILTLRIFTAVQIARPEIPDPAISDVMVEKLGQAEYQSKQNDRNYYVLEYKYGLFPNKSGKIVLPKQRYQINQIVNSAPRSLFDIQAFGSPPTQTRFLSTSELTLNIKAQPDNLPASYWLPSENVTITDNWPEQQSIDVGASLTRSIEIKALGNLAAHIPPLPAINMNGLKSYVEQPELNNTHAGDNFLGSRKENIAIVPVQAGTYILPAIQLHWWDTKNKQFKTTTLPERTLTVKGTASAAPSSPSQNLTVSPQSAEQNPNTPADASLISPMVDNPQSSTPTPFYMNVYVWMGTAAFFIILWIITLVIMISRKNKNTSTATLSTVDAARQQSLKNAFTQLKTACQSNDAKLARSTLIQWAQLQWPATEISTLQQVKQQMNNDTFSKIIDELDGSLYREAAFWNGKSLLSYLQTAKFNVSNNNSEVTLPKLYS